MRPDKALSIDCTPCVETSPTDLAETADLITDTALQIDASLTDALLETTFAMLTALALAF
jgi:hypothetical protein